LAWGDGTPLRLRDRSTDGRFDEDIVRAPNHHEMLDIVAAQQNQSPLAVDIVSVDHAKPRASATLCSIARYVHSPGKHPPKDQVEDCGEYDDRKGEERNPDRLPGGCAQTHGLLLITLR
jgi:hypothetical protein